MEEVKGSWGERVRAARMQSADELLICRNGNLLNERVHSTICGRI
jgi:hypothetical protein